MEDGETHAALATEGLRLWEAGELEVAAERFAAAVAAVPASHDRRVDYHEMLAGVLAAAGRSDEARREYERAVEVAVAAGKSDDSIVVGVARYFLGHHRVRRGEHAEALAAVMPSIEAGARPTGPLRTVHALALHGLGRDAEARAVARDAFVAADNDKQRERIRGEVGHMLGIDGD